MGVDRIFELRDELEQCPAKLAAANARIAGLERELAGLRAAVAANEERVRGVVREAVVAVLSRLPTNTGDENYAPLADAIATRAAKQLATADVRLSDGEDNHLGELLCEPCINKYPLARQAIERLITTRSA